MPESRRRNFSRPDVRYLDTTLWEFGGDYVSGDHPSGRIIRFPNSKVLDSIIYNYSWPLFPYIWNEIKVRVAYNSDLEFDHGFAKAFFGHTSHCLGDAKSRLIKKILAALNADPSRVFFPAGTNR